MKKHDTSVHARTERKYFRSADSLLLRAVFRFVWTAFICANKTCIVLILCKMATETTPSPITFSPYMKVVRVFLVLFNIGFWVRQCSFVLFALSVGDAM